MSKSHIKLSDVGFFHNFTIMGINQLYYISLIPEIIQICHYDCIEQYAKIKLIWNYIDMILLPYTFSKYSIILQCRLAYSISLLVLSPIYPPGLMT